MRLSFVELLIKGIPEGFLDILAMYILTRAKFDKKKYVIISLFFIVITFFVRMLPINYGVNSMMSILVFMFLFVLFCNVEFPKAIKSAITVMIFLFVSEGINMFLLIALYGSDKTQALLNTPFTKALYGFPSTVCLGIFIAISYFVLKKLDKNKKDTNGETGKKNSGQAVR